MGSSNNALLSVLSFIVLLLVAKQANSSPIHDEYLKCLHSQNSNSIFGVTYTQKNSSYLSVFESSVRNLRPESTSHFKPKLILTPSDESEIQAALRCARKVGIQIRIRSGGHDYEGLSYASTIPFVLVDLRNFSSISIETEENTAWIQAGATLGELYHKIAKTSKTLAFVAGVCPTVGVGGHFSGGGYSMMSRKFGLAVDHIIDAKIIDVNGRILDKQSMGEDLFWAIRGGGGTSFGIVIAWKVKLLSVPESVTVFNVTRTLEQNATQLLHKWQYVADRIDENLLLRVFINSIYSSQDGKKTIYVSFTSLFLGGVDELLTIMKLSFPELGLEKEDCVEISWIESILFFAGFPRNESIDVLLNRDESGGTVFSKGKSDYVTQPISENGLKAIWERLSDENEISSQLQFSPYGGRLSQISESATPFPHRAGYIFMIHYSVAWESEKESAGRLYWIRGLYSFMASYVSKSPRGAYVNYRDLDIGVNNKGDTSYKVASVWGRKYFNKNFDRLVHVKTKVDPNNFFRNEQSIPPLAAW